MNKAYVSPRSLRKSSPGLRCETDYFDDMPSWIRPAALAAGIVLASSNFGSLIVSYKYRLDGYEKAYTETVEKDALPKNILGDFIYYSTAPGRWFAYL